MPDNELKALALYIFQCFITPVDIVNNGQLYCIWEILMKRVDVSLNQEHTEEIAKENTSSLVQ